VTPGWNEGPWASPWASDPAVTHDARQDGDEPRALARTYTFGISRPPIRCVHLRCATSCRTHRSSSLRCGRCMLTPPTRREVIAHTEKAGTTTPGWSTSGNGSARRAHYEQPAAASGNRFTLPTCQPGLHISASTDTIGLMRTGAGLIPQWERSHPLAGPRDAQLRSGGLVVTSGRSSRRMTSCRRSLISVWTSVGRTAARVSAGSPPTARPCDRTSRRHECALSW
jgi:hypothetical protein